MLEVDLKNFESRNLDEYKKFTAALKRITDRDLKIDGKKLHAAHASEAHESRFIITPQSLGKQWARVTKDKDPGYRPEYRLVGVGNPFVALLYQRIQRPETVVLRPCWIPCRWPSLVASSVERRSTSARPSTSRGPALSQISSASASWPGPKSRQLARAPWPGRNRV